jgi:hypothetical protein
VVLHDLFMGQMGQSRPTVCQLSIFHCELQEKKSRLKGRREGIPTTSLVYVTYMTLLDRRDQS